MKAVWAAMPADVSFLHFLFYVASAGKLDLLLDTEGGAQQDRFVEGAGRWPQRWARHSATGSSCRRPCGESSGRPDGGACARPTASRCARSG